MKNGNGILGNLIDCETQTILSTHRTSFERSRQYWSIDRYDWRRPFWL